MEESLQIRTKAKNFTHSFGTEYHEEHETAPEDLAADFYDPEMMTSRKLYGKDLSEYEEVDVEDLLTQLTPEEIEILSKEVDPDDRLLPADQRCSYECEKDATGPIDRKALIEHINKEALETPDKPEFQPFVPGIVRGKKWIPPEMPKTKARDDDMGTYDIGDEYEAALNHATEEELVDLAAILGFHSMMNQDQYHASLLNKDKVGLGWDGVTKASKPKPGPVDPPNLTDPEDSIKRVTEDDAKLIALNWNNLGHLKDDQFERLFKALEYNSRLEILSMSNTGMTDHQAELLAQTLEKNNSLRIVNIESNLLSGKGIVRLLKAMLGQSCIEEFRASNQRSQVLGNPAEMEITQLIERNSAITRLGLHLEYNDARSRVSAQLQRNIDRKRTSVSVSVRIKNPKKIVVVEESESACFTLGGQSGTVAGDDQSQSVTFQPGPEPDPGL